MYTNVIFKDESFPFTVLIRCFFLLLLLFTSVLLSLIFFCVCVILTSNLAPVIQAHFAHNHNKICILFSRSQGWEAVEWMYRKKVVQGAFCRVTGWKWKWNWKKKSIKIKKNWEKFGKNEDLKCKQTIFLKFKFWKTVKFYL